MQVFCHAAHSCFLLICYVSRHCCRESPLPLTCPSRSSRPLLKPAHFPDFPPGGDVGPHRKTLGPKPRLEMLWSLVCGQDTPDGEALPPGLCVLSDQRGECHPAYMAILFPNTAARSGSRCLMLWASCTRAVGWDSSQGLAPGHQTDFEDFEHHRAGIGARSLFSQGNPLPSVHFLYE